MTTTNDVYRKIKEVSAESMNPRPQIAFQHLAFEMNVSSEHLMACLKALADMRLIKPENSYGSVKLTLLGTRVTR